MTSSQPFSPLVADILTNMATTSANTTNTIIQDLTSRAETAEATIAIIRGHIGKLLGGPWMPNPDTIRGALWPTPEEIDMFRHTTTPTVVTRDEM